MTEPYSTDNALRWGRTYSVSSFRIQGPCVIYPDGSILFSELDPSSYNRRRGPAKISPDGYITFNTLPSRAGIHRTDGPAVITPDGRKTYWADGKKLSVEEFFLKYGVL